MKFLVEKSRNIRPATHFKLSFNNMCLLKQFPLFSLLIEFGFINITGAGLVTPGVDRQLSYLVPESERPRGIGDALSSNTLVDPVISG